MTRSLTRVLYVDDDRINTLLFVEACRPDTSLHILTAACGEDALESARQAAPDVLVVDLHMPDTDGLALLPRLRQLPGLVQTPAFLCTAELIEEVQADALAAGFDGVWAKPVDLKSIKTELARVALRRSTNQVQAL
jgi:two-component system, OmpR family, response regulator